MKQKWLLGLDLGWTWVGPGLDLGWTIKRRNQLLHNTLPYWVGL